jgi:hypothetical protein
MKKVWHCEHPELSELYTRSEASANSLKETGYTVTLYVAIAEIHTNNLVFVTKEAPPKTDHAAFDLEAARNGEPIEYFCTTGWVPCTFIGMAKRGVPIVEYTLNKTDSIAYVVWERNLRMAAKPPKYVWFCRHYIVRGIPALFASHQPAPHDYLEEDGAKWHGEPFIIEVFEDTK